MRALLALEDGTVFEGKAFGAEGRAIGELVFNTGMAAYQDVLTDPQNYGLIVIMTYPLIGNSGISATETAWPPLRGLIARECCTPATGAMPVELYMKNRHIPGIQSVDTRALTRKCRDAGRLNGMIVSGDRECAAFRFDEHREEIASYRVRDAVRVVTDKTVRRYEGYASEIPDLPDLPSYCLNITVPDRNIGKGLRIALIDFGACEGILKSLRFRGCSVEVYPWNATDITGADGVVLSGGPGDPAESFSFAAELFKGLEESGKPALGIGLGHQLIALSAGFETGRLPQGHRGGNHPVKDMRTGRTYITGQNHGYCVLGQSVKADIADITHIQLNDGTVEGLSYKDRPIFSVQFHPEAGSGPQETALIFDDFLKKVIAAKQEGGNYA